MSDLNAKLLKMGEQIVANCSFTDDQEAIIAKVADHLQRFWDPRMRSAIKENLEENPDIASEILTSAVQRLVI